MDESGNPAGAPPLRHGRIEAAEGRHFRTLFELGAAGTLSDGQLLERFATRKGAGAELAFAALVERHGPMVLRVARSALRDEHSAHDAFQATFLILARKGASLWVRDSIGPWLHAVAWRVASQARVAEARRRRSERSAARLESTSTRDDDRHDLARVLDEEIARLPAPYRSAVVACHLEGLTQHDAARRLGWPVGTLQSRLDRARRTLRDRLARRGYAPTLALPPLIPLSIPDALIHATARAATAVPTAGLAGPAVLALMEATTKGLFMTPWKIAAATLVMAGGLAASGLYLGQGQGQPARATDGLGVEAPQAPTDPKTDQPAPSAPAKAESGPTTVDLDIQGFKYPAPDQLLAAAGKRPKPEEPAVPPPADGPGRPALLAFFNSDSISENLKNNELDILVRAGYPVRSVPIKSIEDAPAARYKIASTKTVLLVDPEGVEIARHTGFLGPAELARFYNDNRPKVASPPASASTDQAEPELIDTSAPKPWETCVRIKIGHEGEPLGLCSGTIVQSTPGATIILTAAHNFRLKGGAKMWIAVELFDGVLVGRSPAKVGPSRATTPGSLIDIDFTHDVALIRIRSHRVLPASPVVPASWKPEAGMPMVAMGCSLGNDPTAWSTKILDPRVAMNNSTTHERFVEMKCEHRPAEGRSGGGLYTTDGYVAGVGNFADPHEKTGLYAVPEAIHRILDRNGLSAVYGGIPKPSNAAEPKKWDVATSEANPYIKRWDPAPPELPVPPAVSDTDRRLAELERKLDRVVEALDNLASGKKLEGPIGDFGSPRRR